MANLLPIEYQKKIRGIGRTRFMIIGSLAACACALVAFIALLPSYLLLTLGSPPSSPATLPATATTDRTDISNARALTDLLGPFVQATTTPTEAIRAALANKPAGISIDQVTYSADLSTGSGQIELVGSAQSPTTIDAYRKTLASDPHFTDATVPVGALIGSDQGHFTLTLTGTF